MQYRNLNDLISIEGIEVEAGSLWERDTNNVLILVDDDQFASAKLDDNFEEA